MKNMVIYDNYNCLKSAMEEAGSTYGLCDKRTIRLSEELDLIIIKIMKCECQEFVKQNNSAC